MNRHLRKKWQNIFPDFLELLALGLSSGLIFEAAFSHALEALHEADVSKSIRFNHQVPPLEQFIVFLKDVGSPSILAMCAILQQAAHRGAPIEHILIDQAQQMREEQFLDLEKRIQTLGVRLLFPIMLFIFPTIFILIFGSLYLQIQQQGLFH